MTTSITANSEIKTDNSANLAKIELLQAKLEHAIKKVRGNRRDNRKRASCIKLAIIFCSAAATVLLGLQQTNLESQFKNIALILTALVSLLNVIEPFFNFRALWVEHEIALWKFYRLRDKIQYYLVGNNPENINMDEINNFNAEYQNIWDDLSQSWINYRKQEKS